MRWRYTRYLYILLGTALRANAIGAGGMDGKRKRPADLYEGRDDNVRYAEILGDIESDDANQFIGLMCDSMNSISSSDRPYFE